MGMAGMGGGMGSMNMGMGGGMGMNPYTMGQQQMQPQGPGLSPGSMGAGSASAFTDQQGNELKPFDSGEMKKGRLGHYGYLDGRGEIRPAHNTRAFADVVQSSLDHLLVIFLLAPKTSPNPLCQSRNKVSSHQATLIAISTVMARAVQPKDPEVISHNNHSHR